MPGTLSVQGLLSFDPTLFDTMPLPNGLDRETVVGTIVYECAPFEVLIPQPEIFKRLLNLFAQRRLPVWQKLYTSTVQRYDMLSDTETIKQYSGSDTDTRTPDLTRTRTPDLSRTRTPDLSRTRKPDLTTEGRNSGSDSVEQKVSAFNSENYANREKQTTTLGTRNTVHSTGTDTETETGTETETETGTDTETETGTEKTVRERGTSEIMTGRNRPAAELLKAERNAALFDVVHFIASDVKCNFCIMVY